MGNDLEAYAAERGVKPRRRTLAEHLAAHPDGEAIAAQMRGTLVPDKTVAAWLADEHGIQVHHMAIVRWRESQ